MDDTASAIVWYLVTTSILILAYKCSKDLFPHDSIPQRTMHVVVIAWGWITVSSVLANQVIRVNALALATLVLLTGLLSALATREFRGKQLCDLRGACKQTSSRYHWIYASLAGLLAAIVGIKAVGQYPQNWDTLMYHRPIYVQWLQHGTLNVKYDAVWYNPSGNEIIGLWCAAPFSGDFWVGLMSIPGVLLVVVGALTLGSSHGIRGVSSIALVLAIVSNAVLFQQAHTSENDVAACGLCLASISYSMRFIDCGNLRLAFMASLAIGLTGGIKYYALGHASVVFAILCTTALLVFGFRRFITVTLFAVAITIGAGGYWYIRNLLVSGSPFFPAWQNGANSTELMMRRDIWQSTILGNAEFSVAGQYCYAAWRLGNIVQTLSLLTVPTTLVALCATGAVDCNNKLTLRRGAKLLALAGTIACSWAVFLVTPYTISPTNDRMLHSDYLVARFSIIPTSLSVVGVFVILSGLLRTRRASPSAQLVRGLVKSLFPTCIILLCIPSLIRHSSRVLDQHWILGSSVALCFATTPFALRSIRHKASQRCPTPNVMWIQLACFIALGQITFAIATPALSSRWHSGFSQFYDSFFDTKAYSMLAEWPGTRPKIIALDHRYYPLFCSRRQVLVFRPAHVHSEQSLEQLANEFDCQMIADVIDKANPRTGYSNASSWLRNNPSRFLPLDPLQERGLYLFTGRISSSTEAE